ncbi:MAG: hypothetical protein WC605_14810, partial [Bacteroidales bacterium]
GKTRADRLVFSETFYRKVVSELCKKGISKDQTCLNHVSVKMVEEFKGIPKPVSYRFIDV